jgi:hypothetical protein
LVSVALLIVGWVTLSNTSKYQLKHTLILGPRKFVDLSSSPCHLNVHFHQATIS